MINQGAWFRYCVIVATVLTFPPTALATTYTVTDLGSLGNGDNPSVAYAINAAGQVAGMWSPPGPGIQGAPRPPNRAFLYSGGTMIDLGTLTAGSGAVAYGINNKGQVVGASGFFDFDFGQHAFLYSDGMMVDLGTFGGFHSTATAINDAGQVAGYNEDSRGPALIRHPILYSGGTSIALALGALTYGEARAINASGQVVGFVGDSSGTHAFLYTQGVVKDLGTLVNGSNTYPWAINSNGQVVGSSGSHAFLYSNGTMADLGTLASYDLTALYSASGINSQGQIVGSATWQVGYVNEFPVVTNRGWIYSAGTMRDLTSLVDPGSGWTTIRYAAAINDAGQIAATGCRAAGPCHAVLLSPSQNVGDAVEYYNAQRDHYFMTAYAAEIALLDAGHFPGWVRTGQQFPIYLVDTSVGGVPSGLSPVCRFYGLPSAGLDTHFFSASTVECAEVAAKWPTQWLLETPNAFYVFRPNTGDGSCPNAAVPVYRLYNNRPDVNHRYTTSLAIRQQMIDAGWIPEGYGPSAVAFCVPT